MIQYPTVPLMFQPRRWPGHDRTRARAADRSVSPSFADPTVAGRLRPAGALGHRHPRPLTYGPVVRTAGQPYPFRVRPWNDIGVFLGNMAERDASFEYMVAIIDSVLSTGSTAVLAGTTWMHDLAVVPIPILPPPYGVVVVRAPGSLSAPRDGQVLIEHLSVTGHDDRIERPVADAVPLFWRFVVEKFGITPVRQPGAAVRPEI
jgi:hypothetical protein